MLTRERNKGSNTQLGQFFDEELPSISPGQGRSHFERKIQLELRRGAFEDFQLNLAATDVDEPGWVSMSVAVKQGDQAAGAKSANHGKVVGLGVDQGHRPRSQRTIGVKSFGHPWYNTPPRGESKGRRASLASFSVRGISCRVPSSHAPLHRYNRRGRCSMNWIR